MAKLESIIKYTGTLGGISAYTMRGVEGIVLRRKGGPTKEQIKNHENFGNTRRNNKEFGGRSKMGREIRNALSIIKLVADYNVSGPLLSMLKPVQMQDTTSEWGHRNLVLSRHHEVLRGFSYNKKYPLEHFLSSPVQMALSDDKLLVTVNVPELIPGVTFRNTGQYPFFRFNICVGVVPDLVWGENEYQFVDNLQSIDKHLQSDWLVTRNGSPAQTFNLTLPRLPENHMTYIGGVALQFGTLSYNGVAGPSRFGAAKILMTASHHTQPNVRQAAILETKSGEDTSRRQMELF